MYFILVAKFVSVSMIKENSCEMKWSSISGDTRYCDLFTDWKTAAVT